MVTNTFRINGTLLSLQPTEHGWIKRTQYGVDGAGHPIVPAYGQYQLSWDIMSPSEFSQLVNLYNSYGVTGTVVADLPQWGNPSGTFYSYSGCIITEPEHSGLFENYYTDVKLLIVGIRI